MTDSASLLGASKQRVSLQRSFVVALMDAVDRGISTLVDADMTEESTKLQALQVQQQLGIQSLSIANQQSQSILTLFR
jgi:flagellin